MKEWWSPAELADLKLPRMPKTRVAISAMAQAKNWRKPDLEFPYNPRGSWRRRKASGGGYEYHYSVLPPSARSALFRSGLNEGQSPILGGDCVAIVYPNHDRTILKTLAKRFGWKVIEQKGQKAVVLAEIGSDDVSK